MSNSTSVLRLPQVKAKTGLGKSQIYAEIKRQEFPAPIKLGLRASGWLEHEIDDWIERRVRLRELEIRAFS